MKKKLLMTLVVVALLVFSFATITSAAVYYVDAEGNVSTEVTADTVYHFEPGGNRTIDSNVCFRIGTIYLHDINATKIVFPVASDVKSNYTGIAPQDGWGSSLFVYGVDENGNVITKTVTKTETVKNEDGSEETVTTEVQENVSYATQIVEVEFLSGLDLDGASGKGAFSGFTALTTLTVRGDVSTGGDAFRKGGYFSNTNLSTINVYGSGRIQLGGLLRHLSSKKALTIIFHEDCTSTVHLNYSGRGYSLPSNTLTNWSIILNPNLTYTAGYTNEDGSADISFYDKAVTGLTVTMAVTSEKAYEGIDLKTVHGVRDCAASEAPISAVVKTYCEIYNEHGEFSLVNACVNQCDKCLGMFASATPEHVLDFVIEYKNGYSVEGLKTTACTNEGCLHVDSTEVLKALFITKGYSKDTTANGIYFDFSVNNDAIEAYEAYLKNVDAESTVSYGVVVAVADFDEDETNDTLFNAEGELKVGTVEVKFNEKNYSNIKIKLTGIGEGNYDTALHISGYFKVNDGVTYINDVGTSEYAQKVTYNSLPSEE